MSSGWVTSFWKIHQWNGAPGGPVQGQKDRSECYSNSNSITLYLRGIIYSLYLPKLMLYIISHGESWQFSIFHLGEKSMKKCWSHPGIRWASLDPTSFLCQWCRYLERRPPRDAGRLRSWKCWERPLFYLAICKFLVAVVNVVIIIVYSRSWLKILKNSSLWSRSRFYVISPLLRRSFSQGRDLRWALPPIDFRDQWHMFGYGSWWRRIWWRRKIGWKNNEEDEESGNEEGNDDEWWEEHEHEYHSGAGGDGQWLMVVIYVIYKAMYQPLILRLVRYVNKKWFREETTEAPLQRKGRDKSVVFFRWLIGVLKRDFKRIYRGW